jgi:hypothetical protein
VCLLELCVWRPCIQDVFVRTIWVEAELTVCVFVRNMWVEAL